jgi:hypothetical protein
VTSNSHKIPSLPRDTHPEDRAWYRSLAESGQARFYEPSDWARNRIIAHMLSDVLKAPEPDAEVLSVLLGLMADATPDSLASRFAAAAEGERTPGRGHLTPIENYRPVGAEE